MNQYPLWKNLLILLIVLAGVLFALPNVFDQNPAIEIAPGHGVKVDQATQEQVSGLLKQAGLALNSADLVAGRLLLRFPDSETQLKAQEALRGKINENLTQALTLSPALPAWLRAIGLQPMYLGLDLRGGVHVLIDVDMEAALKQKLERYADDVRGYLRDEKLRYDSLRIEGNAILAKFKEAAMRDQVLAKLSNEFRSLKVVAEETGGELLIRLSMGPTEQQNVRKFSLEQNINTLRNRVNALGVAEPVIQQQGDRRIVVQLPGAQDPSKLKELLGATATLEYRLADTEHSVEDALAGKVPPGSKLYRTRKGEPVLLKKQVIVTGNQITDASSGFDSRSGQPAVHVSLDGQGARRMRDVTSDNVGQPMAVVFIENRSLSRAVDGKVVKQKQKVEEVISIANILEPFGARFQTTGLDSPAEAHDLALLLRAGALAAPIEIVEERTIGPSLGQENIDQGMRAVIAGLMIVMIFMAVYYRGFGLIANLGLMLNLVLLVAILSMLQATLTLPGIAGILLTIGMAVDANVLINERIREEIRLGSSPQASIYAGYEKAFGTILDSNVTTLIAAVTLFSFGSGPVKGFAVVLFFGILTSMFTAVTATRALVNLLWGNRRLSRVSV
jgi:preprotein translocase subunit SecD